MKNKRGFTVLEIIICIVIAGIFVVLFFLQKQDAAKMDRDKQRKIAINAIYYALEEGFYKDNGYYPESITAAEELPWIDPNLFTDPNGINLWVEGGDYSYEAENCDEDNHCKKYKLRAVMEKEEDYVKTNRN
ncbi:prepilin-type N-terminal cleavage/methylation domain-containing protein [Candidatus Saccharibacteria bacterium]|nr:prepilin-type N-terminal cleavage/methylation domain-containing protein [Candidatus Saccharibacteria bacterium]